MGANFNFLKKEVYFELKFSQICSAVSRIIDCYNYIIYTQ